MWDLVQWIPLLLRGLQQTLLLFATVVSLGFALGIAVAFARLSRWRVLRWTALAYVELFRGTSLYVTLFWFYFALPFLGVRPSLWQAAVLGCTLTHAAYASEYIRAAILSVPVGQHEASVALGMSAWQRARYIILPQALVALLPIMGTEFVMLLKGTSVVSLIGFAELTEQAHSIIVSTYQAVPVLVAVLCIYYALAKVVVLATGLLEQRFAVWSRPRAARS